jgi:hypothetical protein
MLNFRWLAVAACVAAATPATAQCLRWEDRFELSTVDDAIYCFRVFDDGTGPALYAGGSFARAGGVVTNGLARWNGHEWSALGTGISDNSGGLACVYALAEFDDGTGLALYAAGQFTSVDGVAAQGVARWNGASWSACGISPQGNAALAVFDDGTGPALYAGGLSLRRWNGSTWSTVGSPPPGTVSSMCVHDDGGGPQLYVSLYSIPSTTSDSISRWNGSAWTTIAANIQGTVHSIVSFNDGSGLALFAAGSPWSIGGGQGSMAKRWIGGTWNSLGFIGTGDVHRLAIGDDGSGNDLYALGGFVGGPVFGIERWNGVSWTIPGSGLFTIPNGGDLAMYDSGSGPVLYAGGSIGGTQFPYRPLGGITRWDGSDWQQLGSGASNFGTSDAVQSLANFDDGTGAALFVGGDFEVNGSQWIYPPPVRWRGAGWTQAAGYSLAPCVFAVLDVGSGAQLFAGHRWVERWTGSTWTGVGGPMLDNDVLALAACNFGSGPQLYVGGLFGMGLNRIARASGASWQPLGSGMDDAVRSLASFGTSTGTRLFAGGSFTTAGGVASPKLAAWDGASWSAVGADNDVRALRVLDTGSGVALYAGGAFTSIAGTAAAGIARFDGTSWSALGSGLPGLVECIEVFDDGSSPALYAGGSFTIGGQVAHLARWSGTAWTALGAGVDGPVHSLAVYDDGQGASLFAGGLFNHAGAILSRNLAQWRGCSAPIETFCFGDGSLRTCPCGNEGLAQHGCENSSSTGGALLQAVGTTSPDTLQLQSSGELSTALTVFLQGDQLLSAGIGFGDGLRCVGGNLKRLYTRFATGGAAVAPQGADPSVSARSAALGDPIAQGATRYYQVYYRDLNATHCPPPVGADWNATNGVRVVW